MKNIVMSLSVFALSLVSGYSEAKADSEIILWCSVYENHNSINPGGNLYLGSDNRAEVWVRTQSEGLREVTIEFDKVVMQGNRRASQVVDGNNYFILEVKKSSQGHVPMQGLLRVKSQKFAAIGLTEEVKIPVQCGGQLN